MMDFLKAYPFISMEEYKWGLSIPMIKIMSIDNTKVNYLSEKQAKRKNAKVIDGTTLKNDFGMSVLSSNKQ